MPQTYSIEHVLLMARGSYNLFDVKSWHKTKADL